MYDMAVEGGGQVVAQTEMAERMVNQSNKETRIQFRKKENEKSKLYNREIQIRESSHFQFAIICDRGLRYSHSGPAG